MTMVRSFFCLSLRVVTILTGWLELMTTVMSLLFILTIVILRDWLMEQLWKIYERPVDYEELPSLMIFYSKYS